MPSFEGARMSDIFGAHFVHHLIKPYGFRIKSTPVLVSRDKGNVVFRGRQDLVSILVKGHAELLPHLVARDHVKVPHDVHLVPHELEALLERAVVATVLAPLAVYARHGERLVARHGERLGARRPVAGARHVRGLVHVPQAGTGFNTRLCCQPRTASNTPS